MPESPVSLRKASAQNHPAGSACMNLHQEYSQRGVGLPSFLLAEIEWRELTHAHVDLSQYFILPLSSWPALSDREKEVYRAASVMTCLSLARLPEE